MCVNVRICFENVAHVSPRLPAVSPFPTPAFPYGFLLSCAARLTVTAYACVRECVSAWVRVWASRIRSHRWWATMPSSACLPPRRHVLIAITSGPRRRCQRDTWTFGECRQRCYEMSRKLVEESKRARKTMFNSAEQKTLSSAQISKEVQRKEQLQNWKGRTGSYNRQRDIKMGCFGSKDKLSKEDMDFLKSHTRYDEATIKEWYKGFKQDCPNGRLTPAKFVDMYKMFFPSGNAEEFCDHVFRTFDMDKNGYIDFKEFLLAIDVTSSGTPEEKLKWAFRMYDVDGNGVIDMQEMTKIVQAIYDMLGACSSNRPADSAEERAKNIFAKMDENNDGQLTQDEFLKGCLQDEELSKMLAP